jgi:hypothetical protein
MMGPWREGDREGTGEATTIGRVMSRQPERTPLPTHVDAERSDDDGAVIVLDVAELETLRASREPRRGPDGRVLPDELQGMYYHG